MNKFAIVFLTIVATLLFSLGIGYTIYQMDGQLPTTLAGWTTAFIPFLSGALSIIIFGVVLSSQATVYYADTRDQEE